MKKKNEEETVPPEMSHLELKLEDVCPSPSSPKWKILRNYCASSCTIIPTDVHNSSFYSRKP